MDNNNPIINVKLRALTMDKLVQMKRKRSESYDIILNKIIDKNRQLEKENRALKNRIKYLDKKKKDGLVDETKPKL